jgi:hypothetical protein
VARDIRCMVCGRPYFQIVVEPKKEGEPLWVTHFEERFGGLPPPEVIEDPLFPDNTGTWMPCPAFGAAEEFWMPNAHGLGGEMLCQVCGEKVLFGMLFSPEQGEPR